MLSPLDRYDEFSYICFCLRRSGLLQPRKAQILRNNAEIYILPQYFRHNHCPFISLIGFQQRHH